jgi:alpha-ribazole phosphatase
MRLYLVRHARAEGLESLCYGRGEICVSPEATAAAADAVRKQLPESVLAAAPVYSSPLSRCRELALALAAGRPVHTAEALAELSFGRWEGQPWDSLPRDEIDAWAQDLWDYRPGGGESARLAAARWLAWLGRVPVSDAALVVTHAGLIRVALASREGAARRLTDPIAYASVHPVARADYAIVEPA